MGGSRGRAELRDARRRQPVDAATLSGEEIRERMSGNVRRCGAFSNIVAAVRLVLAEEVLA
jgi:aerobic-type carbon monoxide dehydrogenase small subunit (CoxS/CutS family)